MGMVLVVQESNHVAGSIPASPDFFVDIVTSLCGMCGMCDTLPVTVRWDKTPPFAPMPVGYKHTLPLNLWPRISFLEHKLSFGTLLSQLEGDEITAGSEVFAILETLPDYDPAKRVFKSKSVILDESMPEERFAINGYAGEFYGEITNGPL